MGRQRQVGGSVGKQVQMKHTVINGLIHLTVILNIKCVQEKDQNHEYMTSLNKFLGHVL